MGNSDLVTFGGSALDRAAELRPSAEVLWQEGSGQAILFWKGKPLLDGNSLGRVALDHSVLTDAIEKPIYLGRDEGQHIFAVDISGWTPEVLDEEVGQFVDKSQQAHPDLPKGWAFVDLRQNMTRLSARDAELVASAKAILEWHQSHRFCSQCGAKSDLIMGGWERKCPSCSGKHFPRTDPVVIMLITRGNKVLLGRSHFWPEGMYSLLAGFVEPGETLEAAVRREVYEEARIEVGEVSYMACQPWPFPNSLMIGCRGEALTSDITIDPEEIEDAVWVSREDVMLSLTGGHPTIKPARKGAIARFLLQLWLEDRAE